MPPAANFSSSSSSSPTSSSRWCPTPEQLMILEEMYRAGIRTPNASQIQHMTAQLSFYGKIEGKNVFYWFQNHKARDRQKLRRKLCKQLQQQLQQQQLYHTYYQQQQQHPPQMLNQQSILGYLDQSPPAPSLLHQPLPCHHYNSFPGFQPQVGVADGLLVNYTWKVRENPAAAERAEMEKSVSNMYGHDWMMMTTKKKDVSPLSSPAPCFTGSSAASTADTTTRLPLKTLQLFPVTSTNLRAEEVEESTPSNPSL